MTNKPIQALERAKFYEDGDIAYVRTIDYGSMSNAISVAQTSVSTTAIKIELPPDASQVVIRHDSFGTVWIGETDSITIKGPNAFPLKANDIMTMDVAKGNDNEIYAISSMPITVYAMGGTS